MMATVASTMATFVAVTVISVATIPVATCRAVRVALVPPPPLGLSSVFGWVHCHTLFQARDIEQPSAARG
jgi:hypothetical protein